jgi:anti-sigma factor RsiW
MSCEHWDPLLSQLLDDELEPSEKAGLDRHLGACRRCQEEMAALRRLSGMLATHTEPDPFFVTRFRARRDELHSGEGSWLLWRRLAIRLLPLAVAALLGAAATVWFSLEEKGLSELEARELGDGFTVTMSETPYPVLQMAFEPFPGEEP